MMHEEGKRQMNVEIKRFEEKTYVEKENLQFGKEESSKVRTVGYWMELKQEVRN